MSKETIKNGAKRDFEAEGFKRENPVLRFYSFDGAEPLVGWVVKRSVMKAGKKRDKVQGLYAILCLEKCKNGARKDDRGNVVDEPPFAPGEIVNLPETAALVELDTFSQGENVVAIAPQEKVDIGGGQSFWRVAIYTRKLTARERDIVRPYKLEV